MYVERFVEIGRGSRADRGIALLHFHYESPFTVFSAAEEFLDTIGLDSDDVVGRSLADVFPEAAFGRVQDAIERYRTARSKVRLRNVECIAPQVLVLDIELRPATPACAEIIQLRLVETAATEQAMQKLVASLFRPTSERSPLFLYVSDVKSQRVRAIRNNFTRALGLGNNFSLEEFQAASHPADIERDAAYLEERLGLSDHAFITFDQRMRAVTGEWRLVAARSRVLTRGPDGTPSNMVGIVFDASDYHATNLALEKASAALSEAERTEREHIGRDLHDSLSQILIGAKIAARSLDLRDLPSPAAAERLKELEVLIGAALDEIRAFSFLLHPPDLGQLGLASAIERLCDGLSWRFGMPIVFRADPEIDRHDGEVEFALFRVVQEALMNVHRHARARQASVSLKLSDQLLALEVRDDGIGLAGIRTGEAQEGVGLAGMRARIAHVGGELSLEDAGPGLRVLASVRLGGGA